MLSKKSKTTIAHKKGTSPKVEVKSRVRKPSLAARNNSSYSVIFFPLLLLTLIMWVIYRALFKYPIWFDETVGKAIFFGLPVWVYATVSHSAKIVETFSIAKFKRGLLLGLAFGGMFGFAAAVVALLRTGEQVAAAQLFGSDAFWWEFFLSLMTAFWETLFFFSWIMVVIQDKYQDWALAKQIVLVAIIFSLFHIPNTFLRFGGTDIVVELFILFLFALGQAFVFARRQNGYALTLSHAIWGMVLLIYLS